MSQEEYDKILDNFGARRKSHDKCRRHLMGLKYSYGQANSAVYRYRVKRGIIWKGR
jgi:hypothetical protein